MAFVDMHTTKDTIGLMHNLRLQFGKRQFKQFDQVLGKYASIQERIKAAAISLEQGFSHAVDQSGPIGAFVVGALGEDRVQSWLANILNKPDLIFTCGRNIHEGFIIGLNDLAQSKKHPSTFRYI